MGIASVLLGENNPFAQWTSQNQNFLGAIGSGLAQGQNIQSGLSYALAGVPQAKQLDQQAAEKLKAEKLAETQANATKNWLASNHPDLAQMVEAGMPVSQAWQTAMDRMQPKGGNALAENATVREQLAQQYGLEGDDARRFVLTGELPGGNQSVRASVGQPVPMRNRKTGEWAPFAPMSDGTIQNQMTGELANAQDWVYDPAAAAGAKTGASEDAKVAAAARAALPSAELNFEIASKAADSLLNDQSGMAEQFGSVLGVPQQMTGAWPGTPKANFRNQLDQLTGQAFLNIRQALKGAGAVTDYEGQRGEVALSRAQAAAEKGDAKAFQAAVIEFKAAITKGLQLLREQAQGSYSAGSAAVAGSPSGNTTSTGVTWSIEP